MKCIQKEDNIEREYNVTYDEEKLKDLIDRIIKTASYTKEGTFCIDDGEIINYKFHYYEYEGGKFTGFQPTLTNGDPLFKKTVSIMSGKNEDELEVHGTKVVEPVLSQLLNEILHEEAEEGVFVDFIEYEKIYKETTPIDEQISDLNELIDATSNTNTTVKIELLKELGDLLERKIKNHLFNTELLKAYYEEAKSIFEFELVRETKTTSGVKTFYKDIFDNKRQSK